MVDGLFNEPNYLAAKKMLDAVALRQDAISSNLANVETPGYKRVDLAPSFQSQLEHACASRDPQQLATLQPSISTDLNAVPTGRDGNTVNLEDEMLRMNQNTILHSVETQLVSSTFYRLRMAISGKSS
jgi:flagellar basal-body rod protein FlgB